MTATDSETVFDGQADAGEWVPTRVALERLGIGERTLFRRIERGQLRKRTRADGRIEVLVPLSAGQSQTDTARQASAEQAERALALVERFGQAVAQQVSPLLDRLAQAQQRIEALAEDRGRLAAAVAELERRLAEAAASAEAEQARLRQRIAELERQVAAAERDLADQAQLQARLAELERRLSDALPATVGDSEPGLQAGRQPPWWAFWRW